jgi:hypothetical protein
MVNQMSKRRRGGGQPGNLNGMKKPGVLPPDLDSVESILKFQRQVISDLYCGKLGSRAAGSINNALKTLLSYHLDAKKLAEYERYFQRIKTMLDDQDDSGKEQA